MSSPINVNSIVWVSSAVVAGILGVAGLVILSQIRTEHRAHNVNDNSEALRNQISVLQKEIEALRELQKEAAQKKKRNRQHAKKNKSISYASDTDTADFRSVIETDVESDEEYFDVSDTDEDITLTEDVEIDAENQVGWLKKALDSIDILWNNGSDAEVKEAYEALLELSESKKPLTMYQTSELKWRLCRCCQRMANICEQNNDVDRKKDLINEGIEFGKEALLNNSESFNAHKWYAILIGLRSKSSGPADRINDGNLYVHHIQEAIKLNPTEPSLYHLQGRFKIEIAALSWFERKAASALFGDLPIATYDDALSDFEKADELYPKEWKENKLFIAKCYINKKKYKEAVKWLKTTIGIETITSDDRVVDTEAKALLEKYE